MNPHDATEQAYGYGYDAGYKAAKQIRHWHAWTTERIVYSKKAGTYAWREYHYITCSGCGYGTIIKSNYCPDCGAKMQ